MFLIRIFSRRRRSGAILIALLLACEATSLAQNVTETSLKAAFIYNFAKFTEWPVALPATTPVVLCVLGDAAVSDALEGTVKGRDLAGHGITVSRVTADGMLRACHILYVSGVTPAEAARIASTLAGAPVLTISDVEEFARRGGIAQFFVEAGRIAFCINVEPARRSRLQLSSKLLALAKCPR